MSNLKRLSLTNLKAYFGLYKSCANAGPRKQLPFTFQERCIIFLEQKMYKLNQFGYNQKKEDINKTLRKKKDCKYTQNYYVKGADSQDLFKRNPLNIKSYI